jgi:Fe2+ transport system protein FeoA
MEKTLKDFKPGERGTVKAVRADGNMRRRLFDMGMTPGAEIVMKKAAPLGDPIEVSVRGYDLSLRKSEAETVVMEVQA